jgi:hypothetical protein
MVRNIAAALRVSLDPAGLRKNSCAIGCGPCAWAADELERMDKLVDATLVALLVVERSVAIGPKRLCPACGFYEGPNPALRFDCPIDAAMTAAGLPDQASRDAERARRMLATRREAR